MEIREALKEQLVQPLIKNVYILVDGIGIKLIPIDELDEFAKLHSYVCSGEDDGRGPGTLPRYKPNLKDNNL